MRNQGTNTGNAPVITSFTPASCRSGQQVTINGSGFQSGGSVHFGTYKAGSVRWNNAEQIIATVPNDASGTLEIKVTTPTGASATAGQKLSVT